MRLVPVLLAVAVVIAACGNGQDSARPKESARPELTAQQIATEIDKLFPSSGGADPSYRATIIQQTRRPDGSQEESTTDEVVLGEDSYTHDASGIETLTVDGTTYTRTDTSGEWKTAAELGFDFSPLEDYFENTGSELESLPSDFFDDVEFERLPDELVSNRHALVVRASMDAFLEIFLRGLQETLEDLPTPPPDRSDPPIPDRQTGDATFWIDAESLEPIRLRLDFISYLENDEIERQLIETTYRDIGEVEDLPVDLPDTDT